MRLDESLGDGQAQAGTASRRAGAVALERHVEDSRKVFSGNAATRITHRDVGIVRAFVVDARLDDDRAVARRVSNRVLEQVAQRPEYLRGRNVEFRRWTDEPALEVDAFRGRDGRRAGQDVGNEVT